jgi:hypothetical protein
VAAISNPSSYASAALRGPEGCEHAAGPRSWQAASAAESGRGCALVPAHRGRRLSLCRGGCVCSETRHAGLAGVRACAGWLVACRGRRPGSVGPSRMGVRGGRLRERRERAGLRIGRPRAARRRAAGGGPPRPRALCAPGLRAPGDARGGGRGTSEGRAIHFLHLCRTRGRSAPGPTKGARAARGARARRAAPPRRPGAAGGRGWRRPARAGGGRAGLAGQMGRCRIVQSKGEGRPCCGAHCRVHTGWRGAGHACTHVHAEGFSGRQKGMLWPREGAPDCVPAAPAGAGGAAGRRGAGRAVDGASPAAGAREK